MNNRLICFNIYKIVSILLVINLLGMTACSYKNNQKEKVKLTIWTSAEKVSAMEDIMIDFCEEHSKDAEIECVVKAKREDICKDAVLENPQKAADIFTFTDDQLDELVDASVLYKYSEKAMDEMLLKAGAEDSRVVNSVILDDAMYAYPESGNNGYFLYYNKKYFGPNDLERLDDILEIAGKAGKKITMDIENGWYLYSFFRAVGLNLKMNAERTANECNWNSKDNRIKGKDVVKSLFKIAHNDAFMATDDKGFIKGIETGEVIAGVSGAWNANKVRTHWGEYYGATKLPEYKVKGKYMQMYSFSGFKVLGINANTKYPDWCEKIVSYITNQVNQMKIFKHSGEPPTNKQAFRTPEVVSSPAVRALVIQSRYSDIQRIAPSFWDASNKLGKFITDKKSKEKDIQNQLDKMVEEATKVK